MTPSVRSPGDKGSFSTDVGQELIDEALKAVERREQGDAPPEGPAADVEVETAGADVEVAGADDALAAELASARAELEVSMAQGRDLMQKLKDEHERLLRAVADLDNYKKRAQKEKDEAVKFGNEKLLRELLPVADNFDRALEHVDAAPDLESFKKGVVMIRKQLEDALGKHGVKGFSAKGEVFDPTRHEAMSTAPTSELPPNHVFAEVLRGYTLNERLVRPALVVVSTAPVAPEAQAEPAAAGEDAGGSGEGGGATS